MRGKRKGKGVKRWRKGKETRGQKGEGEDGEKEKGERKDGKSTGKEGWMEEKERERE